MLGAAAAILVAGLVLTLAIPVETWRTGDQGLARHDEVPPAPTPPMARTLWIDTDAACGAGARADPDDCLAIAFLAQSASFEIAGISTVFGNAPRDAVDYTMRSLLSEIHSRGGKPVPMHAGASVPLAEEAVPREPAHDALRAALEQGPLTIVALGPLTNVASVLLEHPELRSRVSRLARRSRAWLDYWRQDIGRQGFFPFDLLAAAYVARPELLRCVPARA